MDIKNEILQRIYAVMFILMALGVLIFGKAIRIQITEGEALREEAAKQNFKYRAVDADRGNIIAEDGSLLVSSLPIFKCNF